MSLLATVVTVLDHIYFIIMLKTFSRKKIHAAVILNFLSRLSESSERQRTKSGATVAKPPIAGSDKRKLNRKKKEEKGRDKYASLQGER